jgi:hypothetical protein
MADEPPRLTDAGGHRRQQRPMPNDAARTDRVTAV